MLGATWITFAGSSTLLLLTEPDWQAAAPKVTPHLPTSIETSLGARESRWPLARSGRYTLEFTGHAGAIADGSALRIALNRYQGDEAVLCPVWTDAVETTQAASAGDTTLHFDVQWPPARRGADWIILDENTARFEIISVSALDANAGTLTTSALALSWPVGTRAYPLIIGKLDPRPTTTNVTAERSAPQITLVENSDYSHRLFPSEAAAAPATVGGGVPAFSSVPIWTIPPDFSQPVDRTEADVWALQIGFARQEQRVAYDNPVRRGLDFQFAQTNRRLIASVERFWFERLGQAKAFFVPTFRADLEPTADLPASGDASLVPIAASLYSDPDYSNHPGAPYLALIDNADVIEAHKVASVDLAGLHLASAVSGTFAKAETRISHLQLSRFVDDTLSWEYTSPVFARTTLKFIERAEEYLFAPPSLKESVFLYQFALILPNGSVQTWRFTSYEQAFTVAGDGAYNPAPFSHDTVKTTGTLEAEDATIASAPFDGNPLALLLPFGLEGRLSLTILEADYANPGATPDVLYVGDALSLDPKGRAWQATFRFGNRLFDQQFPRCQIAKADNDAIYTPGSTIQLSGWAEAATLASISSTDPTQIDLNGVLDSPPEGHYVGGLLECGSGTSYQSRGILHSITVGSVQRVTLSRPLDGVSVGAAVTLYPGYDQSYTQRRDKFSDAAGFLGFPWVPDENPSLDAVPAEQSAGGKKG